MNDPSNRPIGRAIGLRDAKQLAKALAAELASRRTTTESQCRDLIGRLPLPVPSSAQAPDVRLPPATRPDASAQSQPASPAAFEGVLTTTLGDPHAALLLGTVDEPQHLLQKVFRGRRKPQEVAWTQDGALGHGLLFGGRQQVLFIDILGGDGTME